MSKKKMKNTKKKEKAISTKAEVYNVIWSKLVSPKWGDVKIRIDDLSKCRTQYYEFSDEMRDYMHRHNLSNSDLRYADVGTVVISILRDMCREEEAVKLHPLVMDSISCMVMSDALTMPTVTTNTYAVSVARWFPINIPASV